MLNQKIKIYVTSFSEEVTGSNNHVKIEWPNGRETSFIVDCGLFQEEEHNFRNEQKFPYKPENISFALVTHVHTDHVGRLPYLMQQGYLGKIYMSYETSKLLPVILSETSERLQEEAQSKLKRYKVQKEYAKSLKRNKKGSGKKDKPRREKRKGKKSKEFKIEKPQSLIYAKADIDAVISHAYIQQLNEPFYPEQGIEVTFYPNAHIAGAVITVCRIFDENEEIYMLFTGDVGLKNSVTKQETFVPKEIAEKINIIVSESTYGAGKDSKNVQRQRKKHMNIIKETYKNKGTIVYMSNSLERPLVVAEDLRQMLTDPNVCDELSQFKMYLDTSFGIKCLEKYIKLYGKDCMLDKVKVIDKNSRESAIMEKGPKIFICTSPRFYQGSFLNYGARMLESSNVTLVWVAYAPDEVKNIIEFPVGTEISFMGEKTILRCKRQRFEYYSSHVSAEEMDIFLSQFINAETILFNHGANESKEAFMERYKKDSNTTHNLLYGRTVLIVDKTIKKYF